MRTQRRKRSVVGTADRWCPACNRTTPHVLEHSAPVKRRFGRSDYVDLDERDWAKCTGCGFRFALKPGESGSAP